MIVLVLDVPLSRGGRGSIVLGQKIKRSPLLRGVLSGFPILAFGGEDALRTTPRSL